MNLKRLTTMGALEVVDRARQETSKWLERVVVAPLAAGAGTRGGTARAACPTKASGRFFPGALDPRLPDIITRRFPGLRERTTATAESLARGRFSLLGHGGLSFGQPVDWHLDPVRGRRAPRVHWSRLDPLDHARLGDVKLIWELNRHQWLVPIAQAYRLTGEERHAEAAVAYLRAWMSANPPGLGINWASSLELSLRLVSWCWTLALLQGSRALGSEFLELLEHWVAAHATHVERYLSEFSSPNTHLTGEALGLFYTGSLFPGLPAARRWREIGGRILLEQSERQILPDGVYFEQATCYQRYTVEFLLHFVLLAALNGTAVPDRVGDLIQRMLDFLLAIRRPDGHLPEIGDSDGGSLLPLVRRGPDDVRGVFGLAAVLYGRPDYAWATEGLPPEVCWLLGTPGLEAWEALRPTPPRESGARIFDVGGYVVMRSGWDRRAHHLIFDVGPLGGGRSGAHGHADLLAIQCSAYGESFLVDPGTFCYGADESWRSFFRGSAAHSTVGVDGQEQATPLHPFQWDALPRARLRGHSANATGDLADAEHDAFRRLPDPVTHRRRVLFVRRSYWVIVDDLEGEGRHRVSAQFQFAPLPVELGADGWARARGREGGALLVRAFAALPLSAELLCGSLSPRRGWVSTDFGRREPAPALVWSAQGRLPIRIITLLLPAESAVIQPPAVSPVLFDDATLAGLSLDGGREVLHVDNERLSVREG